MWYITLVVKGNRFAAAKTATNRGIPFVFVDNTGHGETIGRTGMRFKYLVGAWYHESASKTFPNSRAIGDLLAWSVGPQPGPLNAKAG